MTWHFFPDELMNEYCNLAMQTIEDPENGLLLNDLEDVDYRIYVKFENRYESVMNDIWYALTNGGKRYTRNFGYFPPYDE